MSARIARGTTGRPKAKGISRGSKKKRPPGMLDGLPVSAETIRRFSWGIFIGMTIALALATAAVMQVPQMIGRSIGEAVGEAGFVVRRIEVKGLDRMNPRQVYQIADSQTSVAMPLVDLEGTRERLLRFGWVGEARVSRRLPDTLVVDIVERQPAAIWQHNQELNLIDSNGVVLEGVKLEAMPDLPLMIGPQANRQATSLNRLLAAAPHLKPLLAGATWIGGRRWDLRFHTGEVLALPEGQKTAGTALVHFAQKDKMARLLGHGYARIDMRLPDKMYVRLSREPGSSVPVFDLEPTPRARAAPVYRRPTDPNKTI